MVRILLDSGHLRRPALVSFAAALITSVAAWLSQATLVYSGRGSERLALIPVSAGAIALCVAAGVAVWFLVRRGGSLIPLWLFVLVAIAWIPLATPALLLWSGRAVIVLWIAFAAAMIASIPWHVTSLTRPQARTAGALAFGISLIAWWQVAPQVPGGDEPHYLVITQSLLRDGDVRIENNHRRGDYRTYFSEELRPDFRVRGRNREIYSIHAPGVSALVAPAFLVAGYRGAVLFLIILTSLGSALAWQLAWLVTRRHDAAWFGWAAVTLSATWVFHTFTVYPDGPGAVLLLTGVWALIRAEKEAADGHGSIAPWVWHGAALALLPWMHSRFAVLAGGAGALVLLRLPRVPNAAGKAIAFLAIPAISFLAWIAYFIAIYGTPDPAVPYGGEEGSFGYVANGLAGLLFDQRFGLLVYAPVLIFAFVGMAVMLRHRPLRRYALELLFVAGPYLLVVTYVAMWWGGHSAPARFFMPLLPWLAIPAAAAWASFDRRSTRVTAIAALVFTGFATTVLVFAADGALAFNVRDVPAQWLEWLNESVDLAQALPAWTRDVHAPMYRSIAVWMTAAAAAWLLLRTLEERRVLAITTHAVVAATLIFALAASAAATAVWTFQRTRGYLTAPSQLQALRVLASERRLLAFRLSPFQRLDHNATTASLRLESFAAPATGGGRGDRPVFSFSAVPAGEYRLRPMISGPDGWMMIGVGQDQFAVRTLPLTEAQAGLTVRFPVAVRALIVRADEDGRRNLRGLEIEPVSLVPAGRHLADAYARHAVRYGQATAYFLDGDAYPEPEAFWVRGKADSEVVLEPDDDAATAEVLLRNGAAENTVHVATAAWREELRLGPGEEKRLAIPLSAATLIRFSTSAGFVPSSLDPRSRDMRYLGVWVKVGG